MFENVIAKVQFKNLFGPALPLLSSEMLSSLSKLKIFLFNVHLAVFVLRIDIITVIQFHR